MKDPEERKAADLVTHEETKLKRGSSSVSARTYSVTMSVLRIIGIALVVAVVALGAKYGVEQFVR
ncbi:MAG: hypothetical protein DI600_08485 [Cutibacterium granulosum]|nr:MAG: hypothetical protein DI600_08485 [Cutibacterium granulosum]